jgi:predicted permease
MLPALGSVLSVILMIALGFALARRGWFDEAASRLLSRLVVSVALPAYMIANLMGGYDRARLVAMLPGLPIPFATMLICFGIAHLVAAAIRVPVGRRGAFASMFSLSNTIFIGLPVNIAIFGEASMPYVLLYYIANTTLFWTIGVYGIARDGEARGGLKAAALLSREGVERIFSPPLVAFLAAVAMIMAGVRLPAFALDLCRALGSMTTPLSMLFIGIVISRVDWRSLRLERDTALVLAGRFVLSPLALLALCLAAERSGLLELPALMKGVFLVQSAMPAMTQTPILAKAYGADIEYAGVATSLTTVLSLATIPLYMWLVAALF